MVSKFTDPRPDLGDSARWIEFFETFAGYDKYNTYKCMPELIISIQGMRAQGTELGWTKLGRPRLVPLVDWNGWESERAYAKYRDKYLTPWKDIIVRALNSLEPVDIDSLPPGIHEKDSPWPGITGAKVYVAKDQYARERMHAEYPWVWVFNKGEVLEIVGEKDVLGVLALRGKTGTFFVSEKRKEKWDENSKSARENDQGLSEVARTKGHATNQDFGW